MAISFSQLAAAQGAGVGASVGADVNADVKTPDVKTPDAMTGEQSTQGSRSSETQSQRDEDRLHGAATLRGDTSASGETARPSGDRDQPKRDAKGKDRERDYDRERGERNKRND
jgi:hypothetical protein